MELLISGNMLDLVPSWGEVSFHLSDLVSGHNSGSGLISQEDCFMSLPASQRGFPGIFGGFRFQRWKAGLKLNIQKTRIMASRPINSCSLDQEDLLEEEMTAHFSILTWENPMDRGAW